MSLATALPETVNNQQMSKFAKDIYEHKYALGDEVWFDNGPGSNSTPRRVVDNVMRPYFPELAEEMIKLISERKFVPGGRYLYAAGKEFNQTNNCLLLKVGDSREEWGSLVQRVTVGLMTGAGIGAVYSDLRPEGAPIAKTGGTSSGPIALMLAVNELGRNIKQGGSRRAAIWAGLHWNHADIFKFITIKDWTDEVKAAKEKDFNAPAPMDGTNISVILDDAFFTAYHDSSDPMHEWAHRVYDMTVEHMLTTAEPGFSVDTGVNAGEHLRNACTEVTSSDDNDICNLGSINLSQVTDIKEMKRIVELGTIFLLCGTLYSLVPYEKVDETRTKNRRLGLGLMGIYEWLKKRGKDYAPDDEFALWLDEYAKSTEISHKYADQLGISRPVKTRAIAPTGTLAIIAETTSGIEPLFASAFKRRYLKDGVWHFQYVIDQTAKRLIDQGVDPAILEDAYDLAEDYERRLNFQAWVQQWVDHGISSTLNLPSVDKQNFTHKEFGDTLIKYLPHLRGMTTYPDGARGGQPITKVDLQTVLGFEGIEYEEWGNEEACVGGVCGI